MSVRLTTLGLVGFFVGGCVSRDVSWEAPRGIRNAQVDRDERQKPVNGVDMLIVVDDSISMADKQRVLVDSLTKSSSYATHCFDPLDPHRVLPAEKGRCPDGYNWQFGAIGGSSRAVITSSVGAGGIACAGKASGARPVAFSVDAGAIDVSQLFANVGEAGCGYEGPLESMYRFLVDPQPPLAIGTTNTETGQATVPEGIDTDLLAQRAAFLHPYSQVVILILTDEDDCSVRDSDDAWKMGAPSGLSRGAAACSDPTSICCRSCDTVETAPPKGCDPLSADPVCNATPTLDPSEDDINLRCFDQKRRFGKNWLFPIERYTQALLSDTIVSRTGETVPNPLYAHGRTKDMVSVLVLSGVPWQLLVTETSLEDPTRLDLLGPEELDETGAWQELLGDPQHGIAPSDPHLQQSVVPRDGIPLESGTWDPMNGFDFEQAPPSELEYSCIFPLPEPRACDGDCTCSANGGADLPICKQSDGTFAPRQTYAAAYPPSRLLEFVRSLGPNGYLGSICPRQLTSPDQRSYGYTSALLTLLERRYGHTFDFSCFHPWLPLNADGTPKCHLFEFHQRSVDCSALGRLPASGAFADAFLTELGQQNRQDATVCEIPPLPGSPLISGTPAYRCANELDPGPDLQGYCYIDPSAGVGSSSLVDACAEGHERRLRLIPQNLPSPDTLVDLICDYGP